MERAAHILDLIDEKWATQREISFPQSRWPNGCKNPPSLLSSLCSCQCSAANANLHVRRGVRLLAIEEFVA